LFREFLYTCGGSFEFGSGCIVDEACWLKADRLVLFLNWLAGWWVAAWNAVFDSVTGEMLILLVFMYFDVDDAQLFYKI